MKRREFLKGTATGVGTQLVSNVFFNPQARAGSQAPTDLTNCSLAQLAALTRAGKASSREVTTAFLKRIDLHNAKLNAIFQVDEERVLRDADKRDQERLTASSVDALGPLHGIPFSIKDNWLTTGVVTTMGTMGWKKNQPNEDATIVRRLRKAGGILLGKTNMPELALSWESNNLVFGRTVNPHNFEHTPGGSSGGAATTVAARMSPVDIGNDGGGSLRLPAHYTGIVTLKDSRRTPLTGCTGDLGWPFWEIATGGPLTKTVEDAHLILSIISGQDNLDHFVHAGPLLDPKNVKSSSLRVAYFVDSGITETQSEVKAAVEKVAKALADQKIVVEHRAPPHIAESFEIWQDYTLPPMKAALENSLKNAGTKPSEYSPLMHQTIAAIDEGMKRIGSLSGEKRDAIIRRMFEFRSDVNQFFGDWDILLAPAAPTTAPKHGTTWDNFPNDGAFAFMANAYPHIPSLVVPVGFDKAGLPIGVQIMAKPFREDLAIATGLIVEELFGGYQPPKNLD